MTVLAQHPKVLESVRVPISMLRNPDAFGGKVDGDCLYGDLLVCDTKVVGMRDPTLANPTPRMVLPRLTECHVHLDKCHTVARMPAVGGDLFAAIEAQRADKELWTQEDIHQRASRGLEELIASGCGAARSHVDWSGASEILQPPIGWDVLTELACDYENQIELQVSPLIGVDDLVEPEVAEKLARMIAAKSSVMGVFVFDQKDRRAGIHAAFHAAEKHNLALDFHVDEGLVDGLNGIGLIADIALETGFSGPVLCGHACSLMNLDGRDCDEMIDKIARSGVHVASLPATNLYLQGRTSGTPDRRGLTRLAELKAAGVSVAVGTDNVCDAFCPLGRHDPRQSLMLAVLAAHLDPPIGEFLPMITTNAQQAIGLEPLFVDGANFEDLVMFPAASTFELLADNCAPQPLITQVTGAVA